MANLKTLKDIERQRMNPSDEGMALDLRTEAIKEIKLIKKHDKETYDPEGLVAGVLPQEQGRSLIDIEDYIMWKFNITKEDLK